MKFEKRLNNLNDQDSKELKKNEFELEKKNNNEIIMN
jgi:hypothetical protein